MSVTTNRTHRKKQKNRIGKPLVHRRLKMLKQVSTAFLTGNAFCLPNSQENAPYTLAQARPSTATIYYETGKLTYNLC